MTIYMMLMFMFLLFIMTIHFKTESVTTLAVSWGILNAILYFFIGGWWVALLSGVSAFAVAWLFFFLSNYLENTIILRLIVLVIGMGAMLKAPSLVGAIFLIFYRLLVS